MSMLTPVDARRRWFGAFFLICSGGMLIWGATLLSDWLMKRPVAFVLYWITCAAFTGLALLNALLDMFIMRCRSRSEHNALAQKSFTEIQNEVKKRGV